MTPQLQPTPPTDTPTTAEEIGRYLAGLQPTVRNIISAARAVARIDELGWAPLAGYPGSDVLWPVHCLLCGWSGLRFYSHLRRARPAMRHRGCAPQSTHRELLSALSTYAADTCRCRTAHATTTGEVAAAIDALALAQRHGDDDRVLAHLRSLLGACPATGARAAAATAYKSTAK
ncbi:hypothetical protein [Streptomyces sp. NPDC002851]